MITKEKISRKKVPLKRLTKKQKAQLRAAINRKVKYAFPIRSQMQYHYEDPFCDVFVNSHTAAACPPCEIKAPIAPYGVCACYPPMIADVL